MLKGLIKVFIVTFVHGASHVTCEPITDDYETVRAKITFQQGVYLKIQNLLQYFEHN